MQQRNDAMEITADLCANNFEQRPAQKKCAKRMAARSSDIRFEISQQEYNHDECHIKITLTDHYGLKIKTTAKDIMNNLKLVNALSKEDAMRIGYIAGFDDSNNS